MMMFCFSGGVQVWLMVVKSDYLKVFFDAFMRKSDIIWELT